jgi:hypothetical protein
MLTLLLPWTFSFLICEFPSPNFHSAGPPQQPELLHSFVPSVLVPLGGLMKAPEVTHAMCLRPGRQSVVIAANPRGSPSRHAAERQVDRLQGRVGGAHQALAEIVEAVPHMPDFVFSIVAGVSAETGVIVLVKGPLTRVQGCQSTVVPRQGQTGRWGRREVEGEGKQAGSGREAERTPLRENS